MSAQTDSSYGIGFCWTNIYKLYIKSKLNKKGIVNFEMPKNIEIIAFKPIKRES